MHATEKLSPPETPTVFDAVQEACAAIAPAWPLDRLIAVNPLWGWTGLSFERASERLSRLAGSGLWMPMGFYREAWREGRIRAEHLARALAESGASTSVERLVARLDDAEIPQEARPLLSDLADADRHSLRRPAWSEVITQQVSQYCAMYFDTGEADWRPLRSERLYAGWRTAMLRDRGIMLLTGCPELRARARALPQDAAGAIRWALDRLGVPQSWAGEFLLVLLLRIHGWAAWCAYLRWQSRLAGDDDTQLVELLAVRLAWECLVDDGGRGPGSSWSRWREGWTTVGARERSGTGDVRAVWQRALEIAYQAPLASALASSTRRAQARPATVQAVFCIDVRSEVFRRAFERAATDAQTLGFAGFFGLPVRYTPIGTEAGRPQLPGLLAPTLDVTDSTGNADEDRSIGRARRARLAGVDAWRAFERLPGAGFARVESLGMGYLGSLLWRSRPSSGAASALDATGLAAAEAARLRPVLRAHGPQEAGPRAELAEKVLRGMGLVGDFARIVLLVGHGSQSANNPHAAGLDCGACGGQTGEVNARALAGLLNDAAVRRALAASAIHIPEDTHFLAALHNTTTDEVTIFDTGDIPASHAAAVERLRQDLLLAGQHARRERATALRLSHLRDEPRRLLEAMRRRASDWAETRPEWGLAGNAALIVAPRARTRDLDLGGRAFLHEYDWRLDADGSVLELIMTAPMIVAHWINMQYYASTVDNRLFGSGNKLLHNVVGARIGVFEGNGGDLRIGLPMQCLHDGERWVHAPLRLSAFIDAPRGAIEAVLARHALLRELLANRWLFLFRCDEEEVEAYEQGVWSCWAGASASAPVCA